ncbi:MAG: cation transporter [Pseudomonadales bacterium]|nr:cation transporter [Pseudomonadales bacterium]
MKSCRGLLLSALLVVSSVWAQGPIYQVGVDGLACPFCAYGIEKQLQKLDGVQSVEVDVGKGNVVVTMKDDRQLRREQVEQAVKKAGFSLRSFDRIQEASP